MLTESYRDGKGLLHSLLVPIPLGGREEYWIHGYQFDSLEEWTYIFKHYTEVKFEFPNPNCKAPKLVFKNKNLELEWTLKFK